MHYLINFDQPHFMHTPFFLSKHLLVVILFTHVPDCNLVPRGQLHLLLLTYPPLHWIFGGCFTHVPDCNLVPRGQLHLLLLTNPPLHWIFGGIFTHVPDCNFFPEGQIHLLNLIIPPLHWIFDGLHSFPINIYPFEHVHFPLVIFPPMQLGITLHSFPINCLPWGQTQWPALSSPPLQLIGVGLHSPFSNLKPKEQIHLPASNFPIYI